MTDAEIKTVVAEKLLLTHKPIARFMNKVSQQENGCWLWAGTRCKAKGTPTYGMFSIQDISILAHRASYTIFKGPITNNLWVLHSCDTPQCVNPDHLFLGTPKDNQRDASLKGRRPSGPEWSAKKQLDANPRRGDDCSWVKIGDDDLPTIHKLRKKGLSMNKIAKMFGVNQSTISRIISGDRRTSEKARVALRRAS